MMATGLDNETASALMREGIDPDRLAHIQPKDLPANTAGIPGLLFREARELRDTNTGGFVLNSNRPGVNPQLADVMFLAPGAKQDTIAHEAEHLMARRQLGSSSAINTKFDELFGKDGRKARSDFVSNAIAVAPYLTEKYGLESGYFDPRMAKYQGSKAPNLLYEQLSELAGIEQTHGVDLTKDPELRKSLFKDRSVREVYNALTGLRQTRLDPRDIPPYTRVEEPAEPGMMGKLKRLAGYANGGFIDKPIKGGSKDI
jgi:hypothetical protein